MDSFCLLTAEAVAETAKTWTWMDTDYQRLRICGNIHSNCLPELGSHQPRRFIYSIMDGSELGRLT